MTNRKHSCELTQNLFRIVFGNFKESGSVPYSLGLGHYQTVRVLRVQKSDLKIALPKVIHGKSAATL